MPRITSYAQNKEDLLIAAFFPDVKKGFYVDVGAHDPVKDSVTKYFYMNGWNGINIEPQKRLFSLLKKDRPRDTNLNIGVSDKPGALELREYPGGGLSTFSDEMKDLYEKDQNMSKTEHKDYSVEIKPLKTILKESAPKHINFIKIDVEGLEYEVIEGNDWSRFRPELICIEANHIVKDWHPLLKKAGYEMVMFDGLNEYFLSKESLHRKELFDYPKMFLSGQEVLEHDTGRKLDQQSEQLTKADKDLQNRDREIYSLKQTLSSVQAENEALHAARHKTLHHIKWLPIAAHSDLKRILRRK